MFEALGCIEQYYLYHGLRSMVEKGDGSGGLALGHDAGQVGRQGNMRVSARNGDIR